MDCPECKSFDVREDYSDGSHVCYSCGLVVSPFLLDDRPILDYRNVNHTYEHYSSSSSINACDIMNVGHYLLEIPIHIIDEAITLCDKSSKGMHGTMKNAMKAACLYTVCKRYGVFGLAKNHDDLCVAFETPSKYFAKALKLMESAEASHQTPHQTTHHHYKPLLNMLDINSYTVHKIHNLCVDLENKLKTHKDFVNKKPCKLGPAIVYAIVYNNYPAIIPQLDLKRMAASSSVALPTLKGNIKAIMHNITNKNQR